MADENLKQYASYLVDRLFDMRDAMTDIMFGKGGDPRLVARNAMVADDKAHAAVKLELQGQLERVASDSTH